MGCWIPAGRGGYGRKEGILEVTQKEAGVQGWVLSKGDRECKSRGTCCHGGVEMDLEGESRVFGHGRKEHDNGTVERGKRAGRRERGYGRVKGPLDVEEMGHKYGPVERAYHGWKKGTWL